MHCCKEGTLMEGPCSRPTGLWVPGLLQSLRPSRYGLSFACSNFQDWRFLLLNLHPFQHANSKAVATCNRPLWAKKHVETPKPTFFTWIGFFFSFGECNISMFGEQAHKSLLLPICWITTRFERLLLCQTSMQVMIFGPCEKDFQGSEN